ncbi:MAG: VOC family protein [Azospirillaceae bacterium]
MQLDHVTLRTRHLDATRRFFCDLFGLTEGPRPREIRHIPGHWLYEGDAPIVHLIGAAGSDQPGDDGAETIDHIAFRLTDLDGFVERLRRLEIPHARNYIAELCEHRLFLRAPGGQLMELVFRET